jgi:glycosyltransferase involved in cell wall biosynthesis
VVHQKQGNQYFGYGPYVREMNLWLRENDQLIVVAPLEKTIISAIDLTYSHKNIKFFPIPNFNLTSSIEICKTVFLLPFVIFNIFRGMFIADHIHLRCPGNIGLLGCIIQILFPFKKKTAKYAGNWDPHSKQPWSYRLQQLILKNTFLTRNMKVLVYGEWPNQTRNIIPFFTATYSEADQLDIMKSDMKAGINLIFVGALVKGKNPIASLEVLHALSNLGVKAQLTYCGDGPERAYLNSKIKAYHLEQQLHLLGNINAASVKNELQKAHFLIFISDSEGWPKVVAEAMWWGCVPITTPVSCVPQMLGEGKRGILVDNNPPAIAAMIHQLLSEEEKLNEMKKEAMEWSRKYTLEKFEKELMNLTAE